MTKRIFNEDMPAIIRAPSTTQPRTDALRNKIVSYCRTKKTVKQVAAEFDLSVRTASNHLDALVKAERLKRQWEWSISTTANGIKVHAPTGRYFYKKV